MTPPRGPESRYHGVARVTRQQQPDRDRPPTEDSPLAALVSTLADGQHLTALDQARMRVLMVDQAVERGVTWAVIARVYGYPSGKQAKKIVHDLRVRVQRELRKAENREALGSRP